MSAPENGCSVNQPCLSCVLGHGHAPSQPISTDTPRPWTDAHRREALRRTYELAAELCVDCPLDATWIASSVVQTLCTEADWRFHLGLPRASDVGPPLDPNRIEREVAIVRRRAEQPAPASPDTPRPWTESDIDIADAAFARLLELSAAARRAHNLGYARDIAQAAARGAGDYEVDFRIALRVFADFDPNRIEREVALVRQPEEQPARTFGRVEPRPIDMILHCPLCAARHVDAPDPEKGWANPPHRSHLCHACGCIWRPAAVATNGVSVLVTIGSADTWTPADQDSAAWRLSRLPTTASAPRIVPCVAALVTDPAGRLLLVRTSRGWELPGGRMEPGETWRDAVAREVLEETGLRFARCTDRPRVLDGLPVNGAKYQSVIIVARGTADGTPCPMDGDAVMVAQWFTRADIAEAIVCTNPGLSAIATTELVREWVAAPPSAAVTLPVIVGRYPTVDEVRAHAAAHPCGAGMGAWLASFTGPQPHRPVVVTLGYRRFIRCNADGVRDAVLVNDLDGGNAVEDEFDPETTWRPLTAEGLPVDSAVVVGGTAEQRGDDLTRALASLIGDIRAAPEATRNVLITRIDAALGGALRGDEMPKLLRAVRALLGGVATSATCVPALVDLTDAQKAALRICAMPFLPRGPWTKARDAMENKYGERWLTVADGLAVMGLADDNGDLTDAGRAALAALPTEV